MALPPRGHSWLVLASLASGEKSGSRGGRITYSDVCRCTAMARLFIDASLGVVVWIVPVAMGIFTHVLLWLLEAPLSDIYVLKPILSETSSMLRGGDLQTLPD